MGISYNKQNRQQEDAHHFLAQNVNIILFMFAI